MTTLGKDILTAWFMGMVLPGMLLNGAVKLRQPYLPAATETAAVEETGAEASTLTVRLRQEDGGIQDGDMDTYLVGVVLAEMPASFEKEALKAQSVVARTYARKAFETGGKHGDGSVCTRSGCCQAYITEGDYLAQGGIRESVDKVKSAVAETSGYVLTYEEELIEATYFSCSGGRTEDAAAVWGTDFPYLQAVDSPGEETAAVFEDTMFFSKERFQTALGISLGGSVTQWLGAVTYTDGGGVDTMEIGGTVYKGTQLRSLLGLRSTRFAMEPTETGITVTTWGYGHRVGMSQYGADAMAVAGSSFADILAHYYPGTALTWLG